MQVAPAKPARVFAQHTHVLRHVRIAELVGVVRADGADHALVEELLVDGHVRHGAELLVAHGADLERHLLREAVAHNLRVAAHVDAMADAVTADLERDAHVVHSLGDLAGVEEKRPAQALQHVAEAHELLRLLLAHEVVAADKPAVALGVRVHDALDLAEVVRDALGLCALGETRYERERAAVAPEELLVALPIHLELLLHADHALAAAAVGLEGRAEPQPQVHVRHMLGEHLLEHEHHVLPKEVRALHDAVEEVPEFVEVMLRAGYEPLQRAEVRRRTGMAARGPLAPLLNGVLEIELRPRRIEAQPHAVVLRSPQMLQQPAIAHVAGEVHVQQAALGRVAAGVAARGRRRQGHRRQVALRQRDALQRWRFWRRRRASWLRRRVSRALRWWRLIRRRPVFGEWRRRACWLRRRVAC
mmetsp:Transcript_19775/g.59906  ORF Transcript_19775/g.59906 Transcript_19775/m.59906 type:complete len:417 (+) Transcript_19775:732-1982(+)